jgi:hypothetical protein
MDPALYCVFIVWLSITNESAQSSTDFKGLFWTRNITEELKPLYSSFVTGFMRLLNIYFYNNVFIFQSETLILTAASMKVTDGSLNVCGNGWFIIETLCLILSIVWGIFHMHDVLRVASTPFLRAVMMMMMMKAVSTSETSVNFYEATKRNVPEDSHLFMFHSTHFGSIIKFPVVRSS